MEPIETKPWYASKGIWGSVVAVGCSVAGLFGLSVAEVDQQTLVASLSAIGAAVGGIIAAYGRIKASSKIG